MVDRYLLESGSPDGYLLESGSGVLSLDNTTLEIVNDVNMTVTYQGGGVYQIVKTGGSGGVFDAGAVSNVGIAGDFILRMEIVLTAGSGWIGGGLNDSPTASAGRNDIDFLFQYSVGGFDAWLIYENGVQITGSVIPNATYAWIWRVGSTISYGRGVDFTAAQANVERTTTSSATLYFDSASDVVGATFKAYLYTPQIGTLTGSSSITFSPSGTIVGTVPITGSSSLAFAPSGSATGKGALTGTGPLAFSPSSTLTGKGALAGTSPLSFSVTATATGKGALAGAPTLSFTPSGAITGKGALSGTSPLSFASSATINGIAPVSGAAGITFAPAGTLAGVAYITAVASLNFEAAGSLTAFDIRATAKATRRHRHSKHDYPDKWGVWR